MTISTAIFSRLSGDATVSGLVGTRIYPQTLPQEPTYPAITYDRVSTRAIQCRGNGSYKASRWQFDCYAITYLGAEALGQAIEDSLTTWTRASGPRVSVVLAENWRDGFEDIVLGDASTGVYRATLDFFIWYEE